jgi:hypothetical protein
MIELKLPIRKATNIQSARERLLTLASSENLVKKEPIPTVLVSVVTESGVVLTLNAWVDTVNFRRLSLELAERAATSLVDL